MVSADARAEEKRARRFVQVLGANVRLPLIMLEANGGLIATSSSRCYRPGIYFSSTLFSAPKAALQPSSEVAFAASDGRFRSETVSSVEPLRFSSAQVTSW